MRDMRQCPRPWGLFFALLILVALPAPATAQEHLPDGNQEELPRNRRVRRIEGAGMFAPIFPTLPGSDRVRRVRPELVASGPDWEQWWALNREAYLSLARRHHAQRAVLPGTTGAIGTPGTRRPTQREFGVRVNPKVAAIAAAEKSLRTDALLAWALTAKGTDAERAVTAILDQLGITGNARQRDWLVFQLGLTREALAFDPLWDILRDTKEGRKRFGGSSALAESIRAMAALAFGAMGDPDAVEDLVEVARDAGKGEVDLRTSCVIGMGLLGSRAIPPAQRLEALDLLHDVLQDRSWPRQARAAVPLALLRLGEARELIRVETLLADQDADRYTRRSCALALAVMAPTLSPRRFDLLREVAERASDSTLRAFAVIAMGEIAYRAGCGFSVADTGGAAMPKRIHEFYLPALRGADKLGVDRSWTMLSAALFAHRYEGYRSAYAELLLRRVAKERAVGRRTAAVVALTLLGDPTVADRLERQLGKAKSVPLRAALAEALGALGDASSRELLLGLFDGDPSPRVRYHAALGLGYLADDRAIEPLTRRLRELESKPARAALTRVIGLLGDRAAIGTLLELAGDTARDDATRRHALLALGALGQSTLEGWRHPFSRGLDFTASTPSLRVILEPR